MKQIIILLALFLVILPSPVFSAPMFDVKTSRPGDKFSIGIPKYWNEKISPAENGTIYAYWDDIGNAITITVREPNTLKRVLTLIKNDQLTANQLKELENIFKRDAPLKRNIKLGIEVLSNQRALVQSYTYRQESAGFVYFVKTKTYDFVANNKQYQVSFSPGPANSESAVEIKFAESYRNIFFPILISFFIF